MVFEPAVMKETDRLRIIARESEAHWGYDKAFMDTFDRTFNITGEFIARYPVFCVREHGEITAFWGGMPEENVFSSGVFLHRQAGDKTGIWKTHVGAYDCLVQGRGDGEGHLCHQLAGGWIL